MKCICDFKIKELQDLVRSEFAGHKSVDEKGVTVNVENTRIGVEIKTIKVDHDLYDEGDDFLCERIGVEYTGYRITDNKRPKQETFYCELWWCIDDEVFYTWRDITKEEFDNFDQENN